VAPFIGVHILGEIWLAGGFDTLAESRWEDQIGPSIPVQKSTIPQSTIGGLFMFGELAVGWNGGPVCGDGNWGEYSTHKGGGRHGQLVTGGSISMALLARTPWWHHNQLGLGLVGADWPGNGGAAEFCDVHFFGIMAGGGVLRHH
jgi:hypothetical protein